MTHQSFLLVQSHRAGSLPMFILEGDAGGQVHSCEREDAIPSTPTPVFTDALILSTDPCLRTPKLHSYCRTVWPQLAMTEVRKLVDMVRMSGLGFSTLVSDPSFVWGLGRLSSLAFASRHL